MIQRSVVWGLGFRVYPCRILMKLPGAKSADPPLARVFSHAVQVQVSGCKVQGSGCRVQGSGFRVQDAALGRNNRLRALVTSPWKRQQVTGYRKRQQVTSPWTAIEARNLRGHPPLLCAPRIETVHCRANSAHIRQSRPDFSLSFQVKVLKTFLVVPFSFGGGYRGLSPGAKKTS